MVEDESIVALDKAGIEQQLHDSEARYRHLVRNLAVGVLVQGPQAEIRESNRTALDLLGLTEDELLGKTSFDSGWKVVRDDGSDFPGPSHPVPQAIASGQPVRHVVMGVFRPRTNDLVWLLVDAQPQLDALGQVVEVVCTFVDISDRRMAEAELLVREESLRASVLHTQAILDNVVDAVITIDGDGLVESFNKAATRMFGVAPDQAIGRNASMLMADPQRAFPDSYLKRHQDTGEADLTGSPSELQGRRKDGSLFPLDLAVSRAEGERRPTWIGLVRDISQQRQDEAKIHKLAFYDQLTGLPNRRLLIDRLEHVLTHAARVGEHGAVLFLDLDNFKQLNETLGHGMGDQLLVQVAQRLKDCVREADSVARLGGDEFLVLLKGLATQERDASAQAWDISLKVLQALSQPYDLGTQRHSCTASIGVVLFMDRKNWVNDLLRMADVAMYQAKAAGRNTVRFYDPAMQAAAEARTQLEQELRRGLAMREFELFYQVQVNLDRVPVGAEALVRWRHPARGLLPPANFIALAEQTGMILELGQWVLETACSQLAMWADAPGKGDWTLAVNVSASQFAHASFVANVFRALDQTGAPAQRLKLELTESMLAVDIEDIIFKMLAIKSRGVSFALDDFGTGYSSLSYLKRLPLAQLKIDRSFVRDILSDPNDEAIVRTILVLGHTMGLEVIAEGVETAAQHEFLAHLGCDAFQGFLFGRPVPQAELVATLPPPTTCH